MGKNTSTNTMEISNQIERLVKEYQLKVAYITTFMGTTYCTKS